jgi:hypothetical protein
LGLSTMVVSADAATAPAMTSTVVRQVRSMMNFPRY